MKRKLINRAGGWVLLCACALAPTAAFGQVQPFSDVASTDPWFNATLTLNDLRITHGCASSPLQYCPSVAMPRDEMAVFIVRAWSIGLWGDPEAFLTNAPPSTTPYFTDVPADAEFFPYIQKLYELKITTGYSAGVYCANSTDNGFGLCPSAAGTLENVQAAIFIARARALVDNHCSAATTSGTCSPNNFSFTTPTAYFNDVPSTDSFFSYIQRLGDLNSYVGIYSPTPTLGCSTCVFNEGGSATRGEMAIEIVLGLGLPITYETTISLTSSPAATAGTSVTLSATVSRYGGTGYPAGVVYFSEITPTGSEVNVAYTVLSAGSSSTTFTIAGAGDYLEAIYAGDYDDQWSEMQITTGGGTGYQYITFSSLSNEPFGTNPFAVTASASSGLPVSLASTTPTICTVAGNTVTILAASSTTQCSITASQGGNGTYAPATPVTQSFWVNPGTQIITFGPISSQALGTGTVSLTATATSSLAVTFTSTTTSVCTVSGTTVTLLTTGSCSITANQSGNSNYNAASAVTQSFTVAMLASQTITFPPVSIQMVGVTVPTLDATASSSLTVSYMSSTTSVCTVSGSTVSLVTAGTCTITANQAGNGTYAAATPVVQSFTVDASCTTTLREYIRLAATAVAIENSCAP